MHRYSQTGIKRQWTHRNVDPRLPCVGSSNSSHQANTFLCNTELRCINRYIYSVYYIILYIYIFRSLYIQLVNEINPRRVACFFPGFGRTSRKFLDGFWYTSISWRLEDSCSHSNGILDIRQNGSISLLFRYHLPVLLLHGVSFNEVMGAVFAY